MDVIEQLNPFEEISLLGTSLRFEVEDGQVLHALLSVHGKQIIPAESKSLLQSGKLSTKKMPAGRFNELLQDYICSCVLRVGRELLAILPDELVIVTATDEILDTRTGHLEASSAWRHCSAGEGTQGPRLHEWAYLELADLEASDYAPSATDVWTRGLLIRRRLVDGELAYFTTWAPAGTSLKRLAWVEGHRWSIESAFETAKGELGLDHNETRSWHGWHRHVSLVMLAFALLARVRHQANAPAPPKTIQRLIALTYPG